MGSRANFEFLHWAWEHYASTRKIPKISLFCLGCQRVQQHTLDPETGQYYCECGKVWLEHEQQQPR